MLDILNNLRERAGRPPIEEKVLTQEERDLQRAKNEETAAMLGYNGIWRQAEDKQ